MLVTECGQVAVDEVVGVYEHHVLWPKFPRSNQTYAEFRALVPDGWRPTRTRPSVRGRRRKVDLNEVRPFG
jgi:hypothetical protein